MAKVSSASVRKSNSVKRKGVHAKKKSSKTKTSKNYRKPKVGQG